MILAFNVHTGNKGGGYTDDVAAIDFKRTEILFSST